jgi:hypothetical protein
VLTHKLNLHAAIHMVGSVVNAELNAEFFACGNPLPFPFPSLPLRGRNFDFFN